MSSLNTTVNTTVELSDVVVHDDKVSNVCGIFPTLMRSINHELETQYKHQRITGKEFASAYATMLQSTLDASVRFAVEVNKANKEIELMTLKIAEQEIINNELAATKLAERSLIESKLADAEYVRVNMRPQELLGMIADVEGSQAKTSLLESELTDLRPEQILKLKAEVITATAQAGLLDHELTSMRPQQLLNEIARVALSTAQVDLTQAKALTEAQATLATTEQVILYRNQAKAFVSKHNLELAGTVVDAYVLAQTQDINLADTSTAFGHNLGAALTNAQWV